MKTAAVRPFRQHVKIDIAFQARTSTLVGIGLSFFSETWPLPCLAQLHSCRRNPVAVAPQQSTLYDDVRGSLFWDRNILSAARPHPRLLQRMRPIHRHLNTIIHRPQRILVGGTKDLCCLRWTKDFCFHRLHRRHRAAIPCDQQHEEVTSIGHHC